MAMTKNIEITINAIKALGVSIELGRYNPGDGWMRYSVTINDWHAIKEGMTRGECYLYLQGVHDVLRVQETMRTKPVATKKMTARILNKALKDAGIKERLYQGKGYVYFIDGDAHKWYSSSIPICYISQMTVEDALSWHKELSAK